MADSVSILVEPMTPRRKTETAKEHYKVLLVDDHPIVRHGFAQLINRDAGLTVCGEADDVPQAMESIQSCQPNVVIVDITLKSGSGLDLIKNIKAQHPHLPILVVSMHDESLYAERVLRAGGRGYLTKQEAVDNILVAIHRVLKGEIYLSQKMTGRLLFRLADGKTQLTGSPVDTLSDRELEVFQLIGQGSGTSQIAERLHLSVKTVETYREHLKQKLNLKNAAELVQHAVQWSQTQGARSSNG
jgi:DNA-binding NarL/FixJ family response regulator